MAEQQAKIEQERKEFQAEKKMIEEREKFEREKAEFEARKKALEMGTVGGATPAAGSVAPG